MASGLAGKRIAITGSRKIKELSEIIERQGGEAVVRPQQGLLVLQEKEVAHELLRLLESGTDWAIFTTGTGLEALLEQAKQIGIYEQLLDLFQRTNVGVRGYKTFAQLKQLGIRPTAVDEDGTTKGLIQALRNYDHTGQSVTIQLHGEPMPELVSFLKREVQLSEPFSLIDMYLPIRGYRFYFVRKY